DAVDKVSRIRERLLATQSRQKSYVVSGCTLLNGRIALRQSGVLMEGVRSPDG
ncbi:hypothetical protein ACLOJK_034462, partial [Asimina triloba]